MPLYSASFFFWLRLFSFSDRCSLFYHLSMHETKTKLNIYHQSQKIQHSPSATINLKQRRSPLSPASFLDRLFSPQQEVSTLWFSFLVVVFFFSLLWVAIARIWWLWSGGIPRLLWNILPQGQMFSSISHEGIQCFGILLSACPSLCHPTRMHTPISLAACSAEAITNASGKAKTQR